MKKVIAAKNRNDPDRFDSYSYQQYKRHEIDVNNIDAIQTNTKGLKNLTLNIYRNTDINNAGSRMLPIYFSEIISGDYHRRFPKVDNETILAKKNLGLQSDELLRKLDKFSFIFNLYDDWLPVFNQTYASPLNRNAFDYYNFYFTDSSILDGKKIYKLHFSPKQKFERAFFGSLWINDETYAVNKVDMQLSKSANLNFIDDLHYSQEYRPALDSATSKLQYMPYKLSSIVDFETGLELLGIPQKAKKKTQCN